MSEDPFEVLGVSPDADEPTLKRAYAALIRQHRPDREPAAFQRIHEAYEAALASLAWRHWVPPVELDEVDAAPEPAADVGPPERLWEQVARGDLDEARRQLEAARTGVAYTQLFLLDELLGQPFDEAARWLVSAAEHGLGGWIAGALDRAELSRFVRRPDVTWRTADAMLTRVRVRERLRHEPLTDVLAEVSTAAYRRAAQQAPWLREQALTVACVAALEPELCHEAEALAVLHQRDGQHGRLEAIFEAQCELRAPYGRWRDSGDCPEGLVNLIRLHPFGELEDLVSADWPWERVLAALDGMEDVLLFELIEATEVASEAEMLQGRRGDADRARAFIRATERRINSGPIGEVLMLLIALALVAVIAQLGGVPAVLAGVMAAIVLAAVAIPYCRRRTCRIVRQGVFELVTRHGLPPLRIAQLVWPGRSTQPHIERYQSAIADDVQMTALWQLVRLGSRS